LLAGCAALTFGGAMAAPAQAEEGQRTYRIARQGLGEALRAFAITSGRDVVFAPEVVNGKMAGSVRGKRSDQAALEALLAGTGLVYERTALGGYVVKAARTRVGALTRDGIERAAFQQAGPSSSAAVQGDDDAVALEEIVVTAQKRSERLQDVPAAVSALSSKDLQRLNAVSFADYVGRVPGFNMISSRSGEGQIILRGLSTGTDQAAATVATYIDETPFGSSTAHTQGSSLTPDLDPSDMERIELLRGPQGTLYGASSLGGVLKFVTKAPELDGIHASLRVDGSTIDGGGSGGGVRAMFNAPLIQDKLAIRVSAFKREDPGFIDDAGRGETDLNTVHAEGYRVQVLWKPTEALSIRGSILSQRLKNNGDNIEYIDVGTGKPLFGETQQRNGSPVSIANQYRVYNVVGTLDLGWGQLVSSTSFSRNRSDQHLDITYAYGDYIGGALGIDNMGLTQPFKPRQSKFTQELRLTGEGELFDWQVGGFFTHERSQYFQGIDTFDTVTGEKTDIGVVLFRGDLFQRYTELAGFGNVTWHITPKFDLLVGGRYARNEQSFTLIGDGLLATGTSNDPQRQYGESKEGAFTFLVAPRYKITDDVMVYGRVASGYRPGGPNGITVATAPFAPKTYDSDRVVNWEAGIKGSFLDRRLDIDLAAFYIDWTDVQLTGQVAGLRFLANGGTARSQGVEASFKFVPVRGLTIAGNASYTDAELTEDTKPGVFGLAGEPLPYVPDWGANLSADYDWVIADDWNAYVGASWNYVGDRITDLRSTSASHPRETIPSFSKFDLRAGVAHGSYSLDLFVKNVSNERGITAMGPLTIYDDSDQFAASLIQPRTFGFSLSARY
jgi:iron complex outermembrane receptor protein